MDWFNRKAVKALTEKVTALEAAHAQQHVDHLNRIRSTHEAIAELQRRVQEHAATFRAKDPA